MESSRAMSAEVGTAPPTHEVVGFRSLMWFAWVIGTAGAGKLVGEGVPREAVGTGEFMGAGGMLENGIREGRGERRAVY